MANNFNKSLNQSKLDLPRVPIYKKKGFVWLFVLVAVIFILAVGSGYWFLLKGNDSSTDSSNKSTTETFEKTNIPESEKKDRIETSLSEGEELLGILPDDDQFNKQEDKSYNPSRANIYGGVFFSEDGKHYMYTYTIYIDTETNKKIPRLSLDPKLTEKFRQRKIESYQIVVLDGQEIFKSSDSSLIRIIGFAPSTDGKYRYAFEVHKGHAGSRAGKYYVVDGQEQKTYYDVSNFQFSNNGEHFMYEVKHSDEPLVDDDFYVVYDGIEQSKYKLVLHSQFSTDGNHYAYKASYEYLSGDDFYVIDGQPLPAYKIVDKFTFSEDSQRYAYTALTDNGRILMLNDEVIDSMPKGISGGFYQLTFSLDSQELAYVKRENKKEYLIKNNQIIKTVDFSKATIIPGSSFIYDLTYSPDMQHFAYVLRYERPYYVVIDNKEETIEDKADRVDLLTFSEDSKRFAYKYRRIINDEIVLDGQVLENVTTGTNQNITEIMFSPDSKKFIYFVRDTYNPTTGHDLDFTSDMYVVINGQLEEEMYDNVYNMHFDQSDNLVFNALRNDAILLVTKSID